MPDYLLIGFKEPDYTDDFLEENIDYGYKGEFSPIYLIDFIQSIIEEE